MGLELELHSYLINPQDSSTWLKVRGIMRIWRLQPIVLDSTSWQASAYHREVIVRAKDESEARQVAIREFGIATKVKLGQRIITPILRCPRNRGRSSQRKFAGPHTYDATPILRMMASALVSSPGEFHPEATHQPRNSRSGDRIATG
jgi:hypothetical protein